MYRHRARLVFALALFAALCAAPAQAVTRAEMLSYLWEALGYQAAPEMKLPPDVPISHEHAKRIGHAGRFGLVSIEEPFWPDDAINRHDAIELALRMMGWGFELSLYESLESLPDFGGSGDSVFFLAAEMKPAAPDALLIDGATPLSETGRASIVDWVRSCAKFVQWNRVFAYGGTELSLFRQGVARPGVPNEPREGNPIGAPACEPFFIAALAVHPGQVDTHIAFAAPFSRARVAPSAFSESYDALAVVNGGYFYEGRPIGTMLLNGVHAGKPIIGRGAMGWSGDGTIVFGRGGARVAAIVGASGVEVDRFNVAPGPNEASLYTSDISQSIIGAAPDSLVVVSHGGVVSEIREARDGIWLPEKSAALVLRGTKRAPFAGASVGAALTFKSSWETDAFDSCSDMIQGGPMLISAGQFTADDEGVKADVTAKRHPRTIVGTDGSRVIWAVIDGRSAIHSRGATIEETKHIARSLGMTTALNLDGGGSSQLIWRGVAANVPSDGHERPIPYSLVMLPRGAQMVWRAPVSDGSWGAWGVVDAPAEGETKPKPDLFTPPGYGATYSPQEDKGGSDVDEYLQKLLEQYKDK